MTAAAGGQGGIKTSQTMHLGAGDSKRKPFEVRLFYLFFTRTKTLGDQNQHARYYALFFPLVVRLAGKRAPSLYSLYHRTQRNGNSDFPVSNGCPFSPEHIGAHTFAVSVSQIALCRMSLDGKVARCPTTTLHHLPIQFPLVLDVDGQHFRSRRLCCFHVFACDTRTHTHIYIYMTDEYYPMSYS